MHSLSLIANINAQIIDGYDRELYCMYDINLVATGTCEN